MKAKVTIEIKNLEDWDVDWKNESIMNQAWNEVKVDIREKVKDLGIDVESVKIELDD